MQQQFDFLLLLLSNTLFLGLNKKQLVTFIILEIILFAGMYLNYEFHKSVDVADSFAWHNSIVYARGILPITGLASINDKLFNFNDPILSCLIAGLIVDYFVLLLCSKVVNIFRKY
jgi:hypothetical protein